ncbi:HDOD domain-containing protein [Candidatus Methylobacter oryzae]|uniref:HDOD domain-containing protein n=1 Tax=Candidatus Methylobacter oryzae TaxID=2497749 RepID=A0ABY3CCS2_9GAMM|nr:HDOD domain-containing protein [Candidatus Methylobacter oryzae]TRW98514.1 HDOD domain-containing protein [Candidatus Methylobacter oryzae]
MIMVFSQFKKNNTLVGSCTVFPEKISMQTVQELFPIRNYDREKLLAFTTDLKSEVFPKESVLFRYDDKIDSCLYLLKGTITLTNEIGQSIEIAAGTNQAKFPLSTGAIHRHTAIAATDVSVLRVSKRILSPKYAPQTELSKLNIPDEFMENRLMSLFAHHYSSEELQIPLLPDIAMRVRRALKNDAGIHDIVKIVQFDPVISARLIGMANCPLYVSSIPTRTCLDAVTRIGLNATCNLVTSLSITRIFKNDSPAIKKYIEAIWERSLYISILSYFLAKATKQVNPQEAQLAGLISEIGAVPFLGFIANLPPECYAKSDIDKILPYIKGAIGYKVLNDWGFSEEFLKVPVYSENWYQDTSEELNLTDIVVLSKLHSKIGQQNTIEEFPPFTSIPAAGKLKELSLTPELSLSILSGAKQQINEMTKILYC